MPRKSSKNLRVHNVFSLGPQPTIPCSYPDCPRYFFDLAGCSNHIRTTHSIDLPPTRPSSLSRTPSSPQSGQNRPVPLSPTASQEANLSQEDSVGIDNNVESPLLSPSVEDIVLPSPRVEDITLPSPSVENIPLPSPSLDSAPLFAHSPIPSSPTPSVAGALQSPHPPTLSLDNDSESNEVPPKRVWRVYHPQMNGE